MTICFVKSVTWPLIPCLFYQENSALVIVMRSKTIDSDTGNRTRVLWVRATDASRKVMGKEKASVKNQSASEKARSKSILEYQQSQGAAMLKKVCWFNAERREIWGTPVLSKNSQESLKEKLSEVRKQMNKFPSMEKGDIPKKNPGYHWGKILIPIEKLLPVRITPPLRPLWEKVIYTVTNIIKQSMTTLYLLFMWGLNQNAFINALKSLWQKTVP